MIDLGELRGSIVIDGVDEAQNSLGGINSASEKTGISFDKLAIKAAALAAALAIGKVLKESIDKANELKQATNELSVAIGATTEDMDGLKESIANIYASNLGEDFEDIAKSMASVAQQTNLTGEALEDATKYALMLRETFDWEVDESIRAVDMMMRQFGISAKEAYTLLAQGAQNGLDKNDNLLDSINEYSVHFKQFGFSAEEMFNIFANGAETGVFDIDKLGDAVKEFGIRSKVFDDCGEALTALGFDAEEMVIKFNEGGNSANEAFQQVVQALADCDDKVLQNQVGVELFGTMFEDLGVEAIGALTNINGEFDTAKNTLESINSIQYDDFNSAIEGIGRQMEIGFIVPLGDMLLPLLEKFTAYIQEHMPYIQTTFEITLGSIGMAIEVCCTIIAKLIDAIGFVVEAIVGWCAETEDSGTTIEEIWNSIQECISSVIGFITALINVYVEEFKKIWEEYGDTVKTVVQTAFKIMENTINTVISAVTDILNIFIALLNGDFTGAFEAIGQLVEDIFRGIGEFIDTTISGLIDLIESFIPNFLRAGTDLFESFFDGIRNVWDNICNWVQEKVNWLGEQLTFWDNNKDKMDGSHRTGLSSVPFDGYRAVLHKGEMVLTQAEANRYRNTQAQSTIITNQTDTSKLESLMEKTLKAIDSLPRNIKIQQNMG